MKIEVLYPEICNLYGDLGNIRYLQKSCPELEVVETDLKSRPAFLDGGVDLVYVGSATERGLDYKLRMLLAGIPAERICYEPDDLKALELLQFRPGDEICLLHDVEVDQTERIYNRLAELAEAHSKHEEVQA